jgi:hypothetical protein
MFVMSDVQVTLTLPAELAERARRAGLLDSAQFAAMLERILEREAERQKQVDQLFEDIEKLHALEPKLTQEEIDAEIEAYRNEETTKLSHPAHSA